MISFIISAIFITFQPNISEQENKRQGIYYLLNAKTKPKKMSEVIVVSSWLPSIQDLKPCDYSRWGILEKKTNTVSKIWIGLKLYGVSKVIYDILSYLTPFWVILFLPHVILLV